MSITLGDAVLWLRTNNDKLNKGLAQAESKTQSTMSKLGTFVTVGVGAMAAGIAAGIGAFAHGAIEGNAQFETYLTQFGVLLKDTDLAKERLAELAEFGKKTPFELPQVVEADKILQGFGLHALESKDKFGYAGDEIRRIAGDVASGAGISMQEMATYMGKFASGSTGEVISRFQELGIVTREQMKSWGLEFSKSGELLSPVDESMALLLEKMDEKYGGMMDKQSSTLEGMKSNVADFVAGAIREAGKPIFDKYKEGLQKVLDILNSENMTLALGAFTDFLTSVLNGGEDPMGDLYNVFYYLGQALGIPVEQITPLMDAFRVMDDFIREQVLPNVEMLKTGFLQFIQETVIPFVTTHKQEILGALMAIGAVLAGAVIVSGIMSIAAVIASLASPIGLIVAAAALLGAAWAGNWGGIQEKTKAVVDFVTNSIVIPFMSWLLGFWMSNGDEITATASALWEGVQAIFAQFSANFQTLMEAFRLAGEGDWEGFGAKIREGWDRTWGKVKEVVEDVKAWFGTVDWGAVGENILRGIAGGISAGWHWVTDAAQKAAQAALDAAKGFLGIHSPSDKAFEEVGFPTGEGAGLGVAAGIEATMGDLGEQTFSMTNLLSAGSLRLPAPISVGVQFSPFISTGDKYEAETNLYSIVENIVRRLQ